MTPFSPLFASFTPSFAILFIVVLATSIKLWQSYQYARVVGPVQSVFGWTGFLLVLSVGLYSIYDADARARASYANRAVDFVNACATGVMGMGHAHLKFETPREDPDWVRVMDRLSEFVRKNPFVAGVYTLRKDKDDRIVFFLSPPCDLNRNGRIDLEPDETGFAREAEIPTGTPYDNISKELLGSVYLGKTWFSTNVVHDRWGSWLTAAAPLYSESGNVEGALCVDFTLESWLSNIRQSRRWPTSFLIVSLGFYLTAIFFIAHIQQFRKKLQQNSLDLENTVLKLKQARHKSEATELEQSAQAEEIKRRNQTLVALSQNPVFLSGGFHEAAKEIAKLCASTLGASRTGVWLLDGGNLVNHAMYTLATNSFSNDPSFPAESYPAYYRMLHTERNILIPDTEMDTLLPGLATSYSNAGIRALLDCPIRLAGKLVGVLCIEHAGSPRNWTLEDQIFGASLADFAAIALET